jgi:hypothetical protein
VIIEKKSKINRFSNVYYECKYEMLINTFLNKSQEDSKMLNKIRNHKIVVTAIGVAGAVMLALVSASAYIASGWIV